MLEHFKNVRENTPSKFLEVIVDGDPSIRIRTFCPDGDDKTTILVVPGFGVEQSMSDMTAQQAVQLGMRSVTYEPLELPAGHSRTESKTKACVVALKHAREVADGGQVVIVAYSQGGIIASRAVEQLDDTHAPPDVILISPPGYHGPDSTPSLLWRAIREGPQFVLSEPLLSAHLAVGCLGALVRHPRMVIDEITDIARYRPETDTPPLLIARGEEDELFPLGDLHSLPEQMSTHMLYVVPRSGHSLPFVDESTMTAILTYARDYNSAVS